MRNVAASSIACKSYQNVMIIVMPMIPLAKVAHLMNVRQRFDGASRKRKTHSIALGRVIDASFSSSDMCAPASGPMKHQIGDADPTKHDRPVLDQPPPLLETVSSAPLEAFRMFDLLEACEHLLRWRMIRHNPQRQQKCKESKDVEEQDDALSQREMLRKINVESHSQQDKQEHCQSRLPWQRVVG